MILKAYLSGTPETLSEQKRSWIIVLLLIFFGKWSMNFKFFNVILESIFCSILKKSLVTQITFGIFTHLPQSLQIFQIFDNPPTYACKHNLWNCPLKAKIEFISRLILVLSHSDSICSYFHMQRYLSKLQNRPKTHKEASQVYGHS